MPRRSSPSSSFKALPTHLQCFVVLTAAACGGCNAFRSSMSALQNLAFPKRTGFSTTTVFNHHRYARARGATGHDRHSIHCRYGSAKSWRRRRYVRARFSTVASHSDNLGAAVVEDALSSIRVQEQEQDKEEKDVEDCGDSAVATAKPWVGNGPDPLATVQLQGAELATAVAACGAVTGPVDHPNLEVWMNGPFQAPVPMAPADIIYVDDHIVVINKPSGLLCVPGRIEKDSLATRVALELGHYRVDKMVVHRLDMATSGVVVMARSDAALKSLHQQFRERNVSKTYVAMVHGVLPAEEGEVDLPVCRNRACPPLHMINAELGKPSLTTWRVVARQADRTRVALVPVSGRSHQLRLHMDAIGHPILGDHFYGTKESLALADRCLLHAETLFIHHPVTKEALTFTAPCGF